jgi:hypothetical protein
MATCCFSDHWLHVAPRGSREILLFTDGMPNINPPRGWVLFVGWKCVCFSDNPQERNNTKPIKSMKPTYFGRIDMDLPLVYYLSISHGVSIVMSDIDKVERR